MAQKYLRQIALDDSAISIEEVDVLLSPGRAWKEGVRMIPALQIDNDLKSALYLNKESIMEFITMHSR